MGRDRDGLLPQLRQRISAARSGSRIALRIDPTDTEISRVIAECSFFVSASKYAKRNGPRSCRGNGRRVGADRLQHTEFSKIIGETAGRHFCRL